MSDVSVVEVRLTDDRGSKWIVKVHGRPVANFYTKAGAERRAAKIRREGARRA